TTQPVTTTVTTTTQPVTTTVTTTTQPVTTAVTTTTQPVTTTVTTTTQPVTTAVTAAGTYKTGKYRTTDWLNYRSSPDVNAGLYGTIPEGTEISVYEVSGNWGRTEYGGKKCWVCLDYAEMTDVYETTVPVTVVTAPVTTSVITTSAPVTTAVTLPVTTAKVQETATDETGTVFRCRTTAALNFRKGAGTENEIFTVIPPNTELTVTEVGSDDRWGKTVYQGREGWICLDYVSLAEDSETEQVTEETAVTEASEPENLSPAPEYAGSAAQGEAVIRPEPDEFGIIRGDVDKNGFINILDYIMLKEVFEGKCKVKISEEADVNGDGAVTVHDLIALRALFAAAQRISASS
ncbi:MAG: SH3 domain-containing protein, partial [Oscillospiraceae bacterium]|nr:SH3 domain-containing protein [Oscillospiraceae bacterium]